MYFKQISKVDRQSCNWTKCDTVLLVVAAICLTTAVICAFTVLPRWRPDPKKHHGKSEGHDDFEPIYFKTKCHVEEIELTGKMVKCSENEHGEWCEAMQMPAGMDGEMPDDPDEMEEGKDTDIDGDMKLPEHEGPKEGPYGDKEDSDQEKDMEGHDPKEGPEGHEEGPEGHEESPKEGPEGHGEGPKEGAEGDGEDPKEGPEGHGEGHKEGKEGHGEGPKEGPDGHGEGPKEGPDGHGEGHKEGKEGHGEGHKEGHEEGSKEGPDGGEEHHGHRDKRSHHHTRRFPCMKVHVRYRQNKKHGGHERRGMLYSDWLEAENFPSCSQSSCEEWRSENDEEIERQKHIWEDHHKKQDEISCYYNGENPEEVLYEEPGYAWLCRRKGFQAVFWPGLIGIICIGVVLIRRACFACKKVYHEEHKVDLAKVPSNDYVVEPTFQPEKTPEGAFAYDSFFVAQAPPEEGNRLPEVDEPELPSKTAMVGENVYIMTGPPPTYDGRLPDSVRGSTLSLPSKPPAYEIVVRPTDLPTAAAPAYYEKNA